MLSVTNDGLVGYRRTGGPDGDTLVPDLASALPTPADGGRTFTFHLRPGIRYSNGLTFRGADGLRAAVPERPASPPALHCRAPWSVLHVRADGIVRTCCTLRTAMGDLSRQSVDEVWNGPQYVELRRAFVQQSGIPGTCYRCTDPLRTWTPDPATAPTAV